MPEYFRIGKFVATHGVKGELILKHELGKSTALKGLQAIFVEQNTGSFLPWFVETAKMKNEQEVLLKLEGLSNREAALSLVQKDAWFSEPDLKKFSAKNSPLNLLGYMIVNEGELVGVIEEVIVQTHQMLCRLIVNQKEVLIPLNDDTLQTINHKKKEVHVRLPDGLLTIYLGN